MPIETWLIITAILFTGVGFMMGFDFCKKKYGKMIIQSNIQSLVDRGYLRTRTNTDGSLEILKPDGSE